MKNPELIEDISTDIIDEEKEQEIHTIEKQTWEIIDKEFETLKDLVVFQKDFNFKSNEVLSLMTKNNEIPSDIINTYKNILKKFELETNRTKNNETKLSMIRYIMENIHQIKVRLNKYEWHISNTEILDILQRQEAQFKQISTTSTTLMDTDSKLPISWIIWWVIIVWLVTYLIFKLF